MRNDGQLGPEVVEAHLADVEAVDGDRALSSLHQSEESNLHQRKNVRLLTG